MCRGVSEMLMLHQKLPADLRKQHRPKYIILEPPTKTYLWLRWRDLPAALAPVRASILLNMVAMFVFVLLLVLVVG